MLARTGQKGIGTTDTSACAADLRILEARALAALGRTAEASAAIARAEDAFARVDRQDQPEWARFIDEAYLFGEAAHCFRDLDQPHHIERFASESAEAARKQNRGRRGALSHAALAIADLQRNNVEAAAHKALHAVNLSATVNSSRCLETVRDLQRRLRPHRTLPEVQEFNARATEALGLVA